MLSTSRWKTKKEEEKKGKQVSRWPVHRNNSTIGVHLPNKMHTCMSIGLRNSSLKETKPVRIKWRSNQRVFRNCANLFSHFMHPQWTFASSSFACWRSFVFMYVLYLCLGSLVTALGGNDLSCTFDCRHLYLFQIKFGSFESTAALGFPWTCLFADIIFIVF